MTATVLFLSAVVLAGCMSGGGGGIGVGPEQQLVWVRTDGQSGKANPALADQFAQDRAACLPGGAGDNAALQRAAGCMSARGYVLVPASEAEATAARFRTQTASKFPPKPSSH